MNKQAIRDIIAQNVDISNLTEEEINELCDKQEKKYNELLTPLTPREQRILIMSWGLEDGKMWTDDEMGVYFGEKSESITEIKNKALRKLRRPRGNYRLADYVDEGDKVAEIKLKKETIPENEPWLNNMSPNFVSNAINDLIDFFIEFYGEEKAEVMAQRFGFHDGESKEIVELNRMFPQYSCEEIEKIEKNFPDTMSFVCHRTIKKIENEDIVVIDQEEKEEVEKLLKEHSSDLHYLSFDRQLYGFNPLGTWLNKNKDISNHAQEIIDSIIDKKEVCSLYPQEKLTIFPLARESTGNFYETLLDSKKKHFEDILRINDDCYKTKYMIVDFGHVPNNIIEVYPQVMPYLGSLLRKSKVLEKIYIYTFAKSN